MDFRRCLTAGRERGMGMGPRPPPSRGQDLDAGHGRGGGFETSPYGKGSGGERAPTRDAPTEGAKMGPRLREDTGRWMAHRQRDSSLRSASFRMTCGGVGGDGLPTTVFTGGECCRGQGRGGLLRRRDSSLRFAAFRMTCGWRGKGYSGTGPAGFIAWEGRVATAGFFTSLRFVQNDIPPWRGKGKKGRVV